MTPQVWWYVARAAGLVAWGLSCASVVWGLIVSTRMAGKRPPAAWYVDLHRLLGGLTVWFTALHLGSLVADSYVHFGVADLLVPFASGWKPGAVALGIIAFWFLLAVEVTSLFRRRLPRRVWRGVHQTSFAVLVLATAHGFTAGTDRLSPAFQWAALVAGAVALFLLLLRLAGLPPRRAARTAAGATPRATMRGSVS